MSENLQPLDQLISLEDIPEIFHFLTDPLEAVLGNIKVSQIVLQPYGQFNRASYLVKFRAGQKLSLELPGIGMALVLNPDFDPGGGESYSDFFISLVIDSEKKGFWKGLDVTSFSGGPGLIYGLYIDFFNISEFDIIERILKLDYNDANELINAINTQYQSSLVADVDINANITNQVNTVIQKIANDPTLQSLNKHPYGIAYDLHVDTAPLIDRIERLDSLFSNETFIQNTKEFIFDSLLPKFYVSTRLTAGIEFSRKIVLPVDQNGEVPQNEEIKSTLIFDPGELYFASNGGFGFKEELTVSFPPEYPTAQIGKTGLSITFTNAYLDLSDSSNIPQAAAAGYGPEFKGVFIEFASITLPSKWFSNIDTSTLQIVGRNLLIGTGGISGTIGIETVNGTPSTEDDYLNLKIGNWTVGFNHFAMTFKQNVITDSYIGGKLTIPKLKDADGDDAEVYMNGHLRVCPEIRYAELTQ